MITLKNFTIGFKGKVLLTDIETSFADGALTALIGRNGSGKSTLLKAICGLNNNYHGEILIEEVNIRNLSPIQLSHKISFVHTQRPRISNMKCKDIVALGRTPYTGWSGKLNNKDKKIVMESLNMVGMSEYADRRLDSLSDGECQKIMIARAIAQDTEIILLDEPTSFLDLPTRYDLINLLKKLTIEKKKTIIYSTHELEIALKKSDFIALFDSPHLINLPVEEMKTSDHISRLFPIY